MDDTKKTVLTEAVYAPAYSHYLPPQEDEIGLRDFWRVMMSHKMMIGGITLLTTMSALIYALAIEPTYRAQVIFFPPSVENIQPLNVQVGAYSVSVESVYAAFKRNLNSRSVQKKFFEQYKLADSLYPKHALNAPIEEMVKNFAGLLNVSEGKDKAILFLTFDWQDAAVASKVINDYAATVNTVTTDQFVNNVTYSINSRILHAERAIASKRMLAKQEREDFIAQLRENSLIAIALGMNDRVDVNSMDVSRVVQSGDDADGISVTETLLYYRGAKELTTQARVLSERKNDDAFTSGLRNLQKNIAVLRAIKIDRDHVKSVNVDQAAYPPTTPIKPQKKLIVILGLILGVIFGMSAAVMRNTAKKQALEKI